MSFMESNMNHNQGRSAWLLETLKLELVDGKYKLSKKTNNTWNFMILSELELKHILKLIEQEVTK